MTEVQEGYYDGYEKGRVTGLEECLKILKEEQEECAEDRDKGCFNYSILVIEKELS